MFVYCVCVGLTYVFCCFVVDDMVCLMGGFDYKLIGFWLFLGGLTSLRFPVLYLAVFLVGYLLLLVVIAGCFGFIVLFYAAWCNSICANLSLT